MSYLDRLKADISGMRQPCELTKPTKAPSVSFVSTPSRRISEIERANDLLPDPAAEARRQRVLAMLAEQPGIRYAVVADNPDSDPVIVALGIRGVGTCELHIPREKFDPFLFLELIERQGGTVH